MFWIAFNICCGLIVTTIVVIKLSFWPERFNIIERVGMALIGAGTILTIGPLLARFFEDVSPFDDWSGGLVRVGCGFYFTGRMFRHRIANWKARRQARKHLNVH